MGELLPGCAAVETFVVAVAVLQETGGTVLGLCGGYQMLGRRVLDPLRVESQVGEMAGLGLLPVETEFAPEKTLPRYVVPLTTTRSSSSRS